MAEPTIFERVRQVMHGNHKRGCQGRTYTCSCGYDDETYATLNSAAAELLRLQEQLKTARTDAIEECAKVCDISDSIAGMAHSAYAEGRNYCARHIRALSLRALSSAAE